MKRRHDIALIFTTSKPLTAYRKIMFYYNLSKYNNNTGPPQLANGDISCQKLWFSCCPRFDPGLPLENWSPFHLFCCSKKTQKKKVGGLFTINETSYIVITNKHVHLPYCAMCQLCHWNKIKLVINILYCCSSLDIICRHSS